MGTLSGFAPWLVYWALVGNVPSVGAAALALATAAASLAISRFSGSGVRPLEIGALGTFSVLTLLSLVFENSFGSWALTSSIIGLLLVAVVCALTKTSWVGEPADAGPGADATRTDLLAEMSTQVTRLWSLLLAAMAVSSAIPPVLLTDGTGPTPGSVASILFGWVVPFVLFGVACLGSRVLEDRVEARLANPETVRRTTFVAFRELAIDELFYLPREKAEREVGAGMEATTSNSAAPGSPSRAMSLASRGRRRTRCAHAADAPRAGVSKGRSQNGRETPDFSTPAAQLA